MTDLLNAQGLRASIAEALEEGHGFWRACSGCQESCDGVVSVQDYPYSEVFRCQPGGGCRECGGLGVIWDDTDYDAMARAMLADELQTDGDTPAVKSVTFGYTNWRGETGLREAIPDRIFWGATEWHPEPQWLLEAWDCDKQALRAFALSDCIFDRYALIAVNLAEPNG